MIFQKGDRVITPHGSGSVVYARMSGPYLSEASAYSVFLDEKKKAMELPPFPSYSGTLVPASLVHPE